MARLRSWNRSSGEYFDEHPVAGFLATFGIVLLVAFVVGSALGLDYWWPEVLGPAVGGTVCFVAARRWARSRTA